MAPMTMHAICSLLIQKPFFENVYSFTLRGYNGHSDNLFAAYEKKYLKDVKHLH